MKGDFVKKATAARNKESQIASLAKARERRSSRVGYSSNEQS
jgi:hypothetical protein